MKKTILCIVLAALCPFFNLSAQTNYPPSTSAITGKVTDVQERALPGATIKLKGTNIIAITDKTGSFKISPISITGSLIVSFVSYQTNEVSFDSSIHQPITIRLKADANSLNEVQVVGYGTTTKRLNTGSVSTISAAEIEKQPVTNVLSALSGRAAGVFVQTTNGLPGGGITIQIRGQGSITAGTDPLYIIDGVPFSSSVIDLGSNLAVSSINGAASPLNSINPQDIESFNILKDADATSIYGSRGSNGVVLITTKKGKGGKTTFNLDVNSGVSRVANLPRLLNNEQYLEIRREAYKNDGTTPSSDPNSADYAPDLNVWDTSKSTDWAKYFMGGTAHVTNLQGTVAGGDQYTNFIIGGNYHSESGVLPGDNAYRRGGIHASMQHSSVNNKFNIQFSTSYNTDYNRLTNLTSNFTTDLLLPPDFPLYDASGNYNYYFGSSPLADLSAQSLTKTNNIVLNTVVSYKIIPDLTIKTTAGFNKIGIDKIMTYPANSQYSGSNSFSYFGNNSNQTIIVEPQIEYKKSIGRSNLNFLAGGTYQSSERLSQFIQGNNFSSDLVLQNLGSATSYTAYNSTIDYKYLSVFARATYNFDNKYIVNASIRRDGSSRFGPGNQYGNFGAVGAAWLFSQEEWVKDHLSFLSYGKLRGSYGLTGNDQITDYQYLSTYTSSGYNYQDTSGLQPSRVTNANFHWETTRKLEIALELGFIKDRILLNVNRYRNRTKDQLVSYAIPYSTGFNTYQANLPAVVENSGWEFELSTKNIAKDKFTWTTNFNITLPKNQLVSFQNLSASSYSKTLVIGEPISRVYGYDFAGLDVTGIPLYVTQANGIFKTPSSATDAYHTLGKGYPDFYGGVGNSFTYKGWQLDIFGQFTKQQGYGGLIYTPGTTKNNFINTLDRWQKPGDQTIMPRASNSLAYYYTYNFSSANFFNTSYFRVKNIALSYALPSSWLQKYKIQRFRIYLQGENVLTLWNKSIPLYDPESGAAPANIPPMRTFIAGFQITL